MPATEPTSTISADHARRFLVRRQLLAPPRSLPAEPASVLKVVDRLGLLQFDPIDVTGARSHDIALHARIAGYRRGWCEEWLYGDDRRLIELYNKSLNILPISELSLYRVTWNVFAPRMRAGILREQADLARAILARIETEGPLSTADFADHKQVVDWWWAPTRAARAVMEALFVTGRLGIARRDGNRRYYDLIERLVPAWRLAERAPEKAGHRHRLLSLFRATGLTTPTAGALTEAMARVGKTAERVRWTAELVAEGVLSPIAVEGIRSVRYIPAEEKPILDAAAEAADPPPSVSFIAPLDGLLWDRRLLRELWRFDYMWEIYVPEPRRRWGYYVLPILYGDSFAGRIEPRYERTSRTLHIVGISFEDGNAAMEDPRFLAALAEAVEAYRNFVGADKMSWPHGLPARELAAAIKRLG
jgi:uncharacterized protein YcaQ